MIESTKGKEEEIMKMDQLSSTYKEAHTQLNEDKKQLMEANSKMASELVNVGVFSLNSRRYSSIYCRNEMTRRRVRGRMRMRKMRGKRISGRKQNNDNNYLLFTLFILFTVSPCMPHKCITETITG